MISDYMKKKGDTNSIDYTGKVFGSITVIERTEKRLRNGSIVWKCKCECGTVVEMASKHLKTAHPNCGCKGIVAKRLDIAGKRFGHLIAKQVAEVTDKRGKLLWECECDCGNSCFVAAGQLNAGLKKSCGCNTHPLLFPEKRLRKIYIGMVDRCYKNDHPSYKWYGAKGIKICDEWLNNYESFREWSLQNGYDDDLSIDRYQNTRGNYEPSNCRWATDKQQGNNRTNCHYLTFQGETKTISEWSEEAAVDYMTIVQRVTKLGWNAEDAITKPSRNQKNA